MDYRVRHFEDEADLHGFSTSQTAWRTSWSVAPSSTRREARTNSLIGNGQFSGVTLSVKRDTSIENEIRHESKGCVQLMDYSTDKVEVEARCRLVIYARNWPLVYVRRRIHNRRPSHVRRPDQGTRGSHQNLLPPTQRGHGVSRPPPSRVTLQNLKHRHRPVQGRIASILTQNLRS